MSETPQPPVPFKVIREAHPDNSGNPVNGGPDKAAQAASQPFALKRIATPPGVAAGSVEQILQNMAREDTGLRIITPAGLRLPPLPQGVMLVGNLSTEAAQNAQARSHEQAFGAPAANTVKTIEGHFIAPGSIARIATPSGHTIDTRQGQVVVTQQEARAQIGAQGGLVDWEARAQVAQSQADAQEQREAARIQVEEQRIEEVKKLARERKIDLDKFPAELIGSQLFDNSLRVAVADIQTLQSLHRRVNAKQRADLVTSRMLEAMANALGANSQDIQSLSYYKQLTDWQKIALCELGLSFLDDHQQEAQPTLSPVIKNGIQDQARSLAIIAPRMAKRVSATVFMSSVIEARQLLERVQNEHSPQLPQ